MQLMLALLLTVIGIAIAFQVSTWHKYWFSYRSILNCPGPFGQYPFLYWLVPLIFFVLTIVIYKFHFAILLLYFLSVLLGRFRAKREYIADWTKQIMEEENLPFAEARERAKWLEREEFGYF